MSVFIFLVVSLGVMKLTEWTQEIMPWTQRAWFVSFLSLVFSVCGTVLYAPTPKLSRLDFIWAVGLWGASSIWHAVESLMRAVKDWSNSNWLRSVKKRRDIAGW